MSSMNDCIVGYWCGHESVIMTSRLKTHHDSHTSPKKLCTMQMFYDGKKFMQDVGLL